MAECTTDCHVGFMPGAGLKMQNLEDRLTVTEKGVSNFSEFQKKALKGQGFVQGAIWVAGGCSLLGIALLSWVLSLIVPAAKIIIDDYYHNHPSVSEQIQKNNRGALELSTSAKINAESPRIYSALNGR